MKAHQISSIQIPKLASSSLSSSSSVKRTQVTYDDSSSMYVMWSLFTRVLEKSTSTRFNVLILHAMSLFVLPQFPICTKGDWIGASMELWMVSLEVLVKNGFHVQPCTRKHTIIHSLQNCNFSFDKKSKVKNQKKKMIWMAYGIIPRWGLTSFGVIHMGSLIYMKIN